MKTVGAYFIANRAFFKYTQFLIYLVFILWVSCQTPESQKNFNPGTGYPCWGGEPCLKEQAELSDALSLCVDEYLNEYRSVQECRLLSISFYSTGVDTLVRLEIFEDILYTDSHDYFKLMGLGLHGNIAIAIYDRPFRPYGLMHYNTESLVDTCNHEFRQPMHNRGGMIPSVWEYKFKFDRLILTAKSDTVKFL
jgi:hypothetical protein